MNIKKAAIAGITGTMVKTLFSYLSSFVEHEQVTEPELLGTMLTRQTGKNGSISKSTESLTVGYTAHLLTGIGFAGCYDFLWQRKIGKPDLKHGIIFGAVNGVVGAAIWSAFLYFHVHPPKVPLKVFIWNMLINHILFGITASSTYQYFDKLAQRNAAEKVSFVGIKKAYRTRFTEH